MGVNLHLGHRRTLNKSYVSVNLDGHPGAIGFVSRIIPRVYPIAIIKVDQETGEPIRNDQGLCQVRMIF